MLEQEFAEVITRFTAALATACPDIDPEEMRWRFHFMVGSMLQLARFRTPIGSPDSTDSFRAALDRLVEFSAAGIEQRNTA